MNTSHKMYIRRAGKRGHEEVIVHIDWHGISDAAIKLMAAHYVMNRAHYDLKSFEHALPESVEYQALSFVHNEPLATLPEAPESWKSGTDKPRKKSQAALVKAALDALSPEERQALAASFK